jgi:hypothetical protein
MWQFYYFFLNSSELEKSKITWLLNFKFIFFFGEILPIEMGPDLGQKEKC